ncbi:GIY-YIG nuclease family protein [Bdellovibrio sp. HCB209]|uniref:GIY-YIG nuclease family protein n=1 Tax=Bdellovibrio sp. HCB209 TaxID=3394354 RepID=UPI0039B3D5E2
MQSWLVKIGMAKTLHPKGYWTKERVLKRARLYMRPGHFWKHDRAAAASSQRGGYYAEAIAHMEKIERRPRGHFIDLDRIFEAYGSVANRTELHKKHLGAIIQAELLGLHDMLIECIPERVRQPIKGSEKYIYEAAAKYEYVADFIEEEEAAYQAASKKKILADVTKHMKRKGSLYKRFVYEVSNQKYIYVGLTSNIERRFANHRASTDSARAALFNDPNAVFNISSLMDAKIARSIEEGLIRKHRQESKLIVLNQNDGGGLGSPCRSETFEEILAKAKGKSIQFMKKHHSGTYKSIIRLPIEQKKIVRASMKRKISEVIPMEDFLQFCAGKTMDELRFEYPGVRKRLYRHPQKVEIFKVMGHQPRRLSERY